MKNQIVIATSNAKKLIEIQSILEDMNVEILPQSHFKIDAAEEPFYTFLENALVKARHASRLSKLPAIAKPHSTCKSSEFTQDIKHEKLMSCLHAV